MELCGKKKLHALSLAGFDVIDRLERGEWVCLAASLRS